MGISVADNFDHKSKKPLDARTSYATTALMKAVTDANMYEGCLAYCAETDKYYKFLSSNSVDATLGKWREYEAGGGGGGTSDYADLSNKPSINGVTLSGNKTSNDLGINSPTKTSDLTNDSGFVTGSDVQTAISGKANSADLASVATSGSYNDLSNKPTIPSGTDVENSYKTNDASADSNWGNTANQVYFPFYDASTGTKKKTLWGYILGFVYEYLKTVFKLTHLLDVQTSQETGGQILQYDGSLSKWTNASPVVSDIDYSTAEQDTGLKWIDGKTIYQRTFSGNMSAITSSETVKTKSVATLSGISNVINIHGYIKYASGTESGWIPFPSYANPNTATSSVWSGGFIANVAVFGNSLDLTVRGNACYIMGGQPYAITIQYTKS